MAKKVRGPNLDKYIPEDKKKQFKTYMEAHKQYDLPYWTFVRLAKQAGATVCLRKTAVVDLIALDSYIEEHVYEPEEKRMSRGRTRIENMDSLVARGKKYIRTDEAREMYSIGRHTLEKWAKDAGALRKINGTVLINMEKLDAFIEATEADSYTFYRIPKVLITDDRFRTLTNDAKILYGLMLDRMSLSAKNGWFDKNKRDPLEKDLLEEIYELILETVVTQNDTMIINSNKYPMSLVRSKFLKLDSGHIGYVMDCMKKNTTKVRNIKKYMLAALFNAPSTISSYYQAEVNHDYPQFASGSMKAI